MTTNDLVGRTIKGRYTLTRLLGEGGMGAVYEAEHIDVGRKVAVKLVHAAHSRNPEVVARLKREARATGVIESENIVQVIDAGEDEVEGLFVVMELLRGENLEVLLAREKQLAPSAAAMIGTQAARGLSRAHAKGIVHRDLKPANVVLCEREDKTPVVKLVDFGIAKLVRDANNNKTSGDSHASSDSAPSSGLTRIGGIVGTPQYMSPEQALGLDTVDLRTDVYALGALLYEMIVGAPPIPDNLNYEQKLVHIVTQPAARIRARVPSVDPRLDQLVAEMMEYKPEARPADMGIVIARLAEIFSPEEIAPASFAGAGLASLILRTGANPKPPVVTPRTQTKLMAQLVPTVSAVSVDHPSLRPENLAHAGIPQALPGRMVWIGGGAALALVVLIVIVMQATSAPASNSPANALVQASARASATTPSATTPLPPAASLASAAPIASEPPIPAAIKTVVPLPIPPPTPAPVAIFPTMPAAHQDAGSTAAPTSNVDAGHVFGGAGLSTEF